MKKILTITAAFFFFAAIMAADNKPIDVNRLPDAARTFLNENFPGEQILYVTKDDDLILESKTLYPTAPILSVIVI